VLICGCDGLQGWTQSYRCMHGAAEGLFPTFRPREEAMKGGRDIRGVEDGDGASGDVTDVAGVTEME
jgi:hypothetical protein